ncbi:MAG: bifunctional nuclease family protein [Acidobacteria bacterium]|nr:bifunctional nuclease family protein [Acidobacteriota bacterium]
MTIKGLMLDPVANSPIVVLKDDADSTYLPIWVGIFEANAIALELESVETPRPMTHDLLKSVLSTLEAVVTRIVIDGLRENTFYAKIHIDSSSRSLTIDSRPSDAIALALRTKAPIFVARSVLDEARTIKPDQASEDSVKKWLEQMRPEDFGKYEM